MSKQTTGVPRLQLPQRQQMNLDERSLEQLLPPDHVARTVWMGSTCRRYWRASKRWKADLVSRPSIRAYC